MIELTCLRCGGTWHPRTEGKPVQCPRCKSTLWDRPRKSDGATGGRPRGGALTPRQQQAYDLRQAGKTLREIATIMGTTLEPVRRWIAAAESKLNKTREEEK